MLVQPQQAATVCELDPVQHTIGASKRAQTLDPNQPPENSYEPLNLTLDLEYAHVRSLTIPTTKPRNAVLRAVVSQASNAAASRSRRIRPNSLMAAAAARISGARAVSVSKAEHCPRLAGAERERMILPRSGEVGSLVCQVICQLMGTVSGGLRF